MAVPKDRFWAKVLFKDFIRHYRKLDDNAIINDVKQSMDDIDDLNENGESFGSKMVKWSTERMNSPQASANRINGQLGGRPRIIMQPPTTEQLYDFCYEHQLDDGYAREWYEMCVDRGWKDRNGNPIGNWQGALKNYIKSKQKG